MEDPTNLMMVTGIYVFDEPLDFARLKDTVKVRICLLYTSDAADERSSVDLGGRRIIKKKKNVAQ